ncbi:succinate dehydrogenase iron-sulfur subunit [Heliophilum fasciatum]|uniref:succinate dehydrogenase n=1 Tax=Heliophilum fasciatum TaxID=35700 RepID=A0A4R2RSI7_9FIRM|nr:succinate dehydrogenase iron-sulfur subunit [Heliophilum fasciatum]MCW2277396.1 succinate dehydrogenase / fumarate reductase iron-sulfur subunit [Heliophilum fasciatum]TCP67232.1 succinate dehydrogenase / fumarate reductase iron-sulfur subunit [Heliophilum fasciatum]
MAEKIRVRIKRQDGPQGAARWEEFDINYRKNLNVTAILMDIQKNPVTASGQKTTPVVFECNCLEEVCGACTMVINGTPRQACSALVDQLAKPITLEPLSKFTLIRDLQVNRNRMFESLKKVKAWVNIDGTYDLGPGPRMAARDQEWAYPLSRCMTCGCCAEACPNYNEKAPFIGPAAISQVRLFNAHPTGEMQKEDRLDAVMGDGGITDCGNAQNCVRVCPKEIPLTTSIADMGRQTVKRWINRALRA